MKVAAFRIWCRADDIGAGRYLAVVSAEPDPQDSHAHPVESESRLMQSRTEAIEACAHMADAFRRRIEGRGHLVSVVEMV